MPAPRTRILVALAACLAAAALGGPLPDASAGWYPAASMPTPREAHTATLLPDGRVLVVGGGAGAALYDPVTDAWSLAANPAVTRARHTATLLADGTVLIAGGWGGGFLAAAERYHPDTDTWTSAGTMEDGRDGHAATRLSDGRVLVSSGCGSMREVECYIRTGEVYDPSANRWSGAGGSTPVRRDHSATLLPDGRVLTAGGRWADFYGYYTTGRVHLYDPASDSWSNGPGLAEPRDNHAAASLPDGDVLVAGGWHGGYSYLGDEWGWTLGTAERYDVATSVWTPAGSMVTGRRGHTLTPLADGRVLAVGGAGGPTATEAYDPATNTWADAGSLGTGRYEHAATPLANGDVLVTGGHRPNETIASAEIYDVSEPGTTITRWPSRVTTDVDVTFAFASDEPRPRFECRLDRPSVDGTYVPCTSPRSYSDLPDGRYTFLVRAADRGGNVDASPAVRSFTVDTTAPDTSIESGPRQPATRDDSPAFTFAGSETRSTFMCRLDRPLGTGPYSPCDSPKAYTDLPDGAYKFSVYAIDAAGHTDATPAEWIFRVDTLAPETKLTAGPAGPTNENDVEIAWGPSQAGSTFRCRLDRPSGPGTWTRCSSPRSYADLRDGSYAFSVYAIDPAGNVDPTPAARSFRIDTKAPETTVAPSLMTATRWEPLGVGGFTRFNDPEFRFTSSEADSSFRCRLDRPGGTGNYGVCGTYMQYAGLPDGAFRVVARAVDPAGNADQTPATLSFTVDIPPQATITGGPRGLTSSNDPVFTFTSSDAGASFDCILWGPAGFVTARCNGRQAYADLPDGPYVLRVVAVGPAGTFDPFKAEREFIVVTTP